MSSEEFRLYREQQLEELQRQSDKKLSDSQARIKEENKQEFTRLTQVLRAKIAISQKRAERNFEESMARVEELKRSGMSPQIIEVCENRYKDRLKRTLESQHKIFNDFIAQWSNEEK